MPKIVPLHRNSEPIRVVAKSATKQEIFLYGAIGESFWDEDTVSAGQFKTILNELPETTNEITLHINSPGGDVFDGIAIYNLIKQHQAKVTVYIDGLAASIASIIALAGDEILMGDGALFMIHLPWTWAAGDRNSLEETIQRLMDVEESLISIYMKRMKKTKSGVTRAEVRSFLEAETWFDFNQAKENGFVDGEIEDTVPIAARLMDKATWFNKKPQIKTAEQENKAAAVGIKEEMEKFLARK